MYAAACLSIPSVPTAPVDPLVARLRAGDEAAFATVVRELHDTLRRLARTIVKSEALADEAIQDAWIGVLRGLDRFEGRSSFRTWVCSILVNRARTLAARDRRHEAQTEEELDGIDAIEARPVAWADESPARLAERAELVAFVGEALERLPPRQRAVVMLRDVKAWDSDEVCAALGLSEGNQRVLLHRGRAQLRAMLEAHLAGGAP
jgi:RNA polymerase sigma-70 factor (ECF subfamily)